MARQRLGGAALWNPGRVMLEDLVRLRRARDLIDREYAKPLDVPALARAALMSPGHFSRSFKDAFGETPYSYLMTRRIEPGADRLEALPARVARGQLRGGLVVALAPVRPAAV